MSASTQSTRLWYNEHMTKRWDLRSEFTQAYRSTVVATSPPAPKSATAYATNLRTIVVDALHVTDGAQQFVETWTLPGVSGSPRETASQATYVSTTPLMTGLHRATSRTTTVPVLPARSGGGAVEWTAWHEGNSFHYTMAGSVEATLHYCDLTENERERITIRARALSQGGRIVFAAARGHSEDEAPRYGMLTFDGLVVCELHLLPGTRDAVAHLRHAGIRLVYVTTAPEDIAMYIAHAAGITDHPKAARHGGFATSSDHTVYANVTRVNARRIISALPQPLLIARHPLSDIVRMLEAYR